MIGYKELNSGKETCMFYGQSLSYSHYNYNSQKLQIRYKNTGDRWTFNSVNRQLYKQFLNAKEKRTKDIFNEYNRNTISGFKH